MHARGTLAARRFGICSLFQVLCCDLGFALFIVGFMFACRFIFWSRFWNFLNLACLNYLHRRTSKSNHVLLPFLKYFDEINLLKRFSFFLLSLCVYLRSVLLLNERIHVIFIHVWLSEFFVLILSKT